MIEAAQADRRERLDESEAKEVLKAYTISVAVSHPVATSREAAQAARQFGVTVALKIRSRDLAHKSDVGGVALNVEPALIETCAQTMLDSVRQRAAAAKFDGFTVGPMVHRPGAYELIAGISEDTRFDPAILFGHGGTAVEVINDKAIGLPPLNMKLAHEIVARTRNYCRLWGYRAQIACSNSALRLGSHAKASQETRRFWG